MTRYFTIPWPWVGLMLALALLGQEILFRWFGSEPSLAQSLYRVGVMTVGVASLALILLPPRKIAYLLGFLVCAGLMGWALWLQYGLGLEPCPLCIFQRIAVSAIGITFLVAFVHSPRDLGAAIYAALAKGDILQVLVISVLFGFALRSLGATGRPVFDLLDRLSAVLFGIVDIIMKAAPFGAFGAMAFTVASFGVGTLAPLGKLIACFYATCLLFIFVVLATIARAHGFGIWRLIGYIREEIFVVFGTSSSESALPRLMEKLERLGVGRSVVGLVIPAGYSFNLDGTAIYLSIATVFIAQATNTPLTVTQQLALLALLLITSKGAAGVAGAALIVLAATLSATGRIPVAGVVLILGIHRFMGEAMAVTNLIGNGVATIVVGKWCGQLDAARLAERLADGGVEKLTASGVYL